MDDVQQCKGSSVRTTQTLGAVTLSLMMTGSAVGSLVHSPHALATAITVDELFHMRANRSANSVGIRQGDLHFLGARKLAPGPDSGTTGTATAPDGTVYDLRHSPQPNRPSRMTRSPIYDPANAGSWRLDFFNGTDSTTAFTPSIVGVRLMPFVTNMQLSGGGTTPTVSWTVPTSVPPGLSVDWRSVVIYDRDNFIDLDPGPGVRVRANIVHQSGPLTAGETSYTIPTAAGLVAGRNYSAGVLLSDSRVPLGPGVGPLFPHIESRSWSFFDFQLLPAGAPSVFLPMVDTDLTSGGPVYRFDVTVTADTPVFIDPDLAVGYDYQTGDGDPNFATVTLPLDIGDGFFDLFLWDEALSDWVFETVLAEGVLFDFGDDGVDRFRILGIETSAGLSPDDPTAFITELTFVDSGQFTGTMTPIVVRVPEPSILILGATGVLILAGRIRLGRGARPR